jgi:hypothetical protein
MIAVATMAAAAALLGVSAFQRPSPALFAPRPSHHGSSDLRRERYHHLKRPARQLALRLAVAPDHVDALHSAWQHWEAVATAAVSTASADLTPAADPSAQGGLSSSLLAAAAAAAASADAAKDLSLWDRYLLIFKNTLSFVHSTIDGPLRKAGWDQTWGLSIFLFTASTFVCCLAVVVTDGDGTSCSFERRWQLRASTRGSSVPWS